MERAKAKAKTSLPPARKVAANPTGSYHRPPPSTVKTQVPNTRLKVASQPYRSQTPSPTYRHYDIRSGYYYDDSYYYDNQNNALFNFIMLEALMNNNNQVIYMNPAAQTYVDQNGNYVDPSQVADGEYSPVPPNNTPDGTWTAGTYADQTGTYADTSNTYQSQAIPDSTYTSDGTTGGDYAAAVDLGASSFS
jgi:hypothetical protein